MRFEQERLSAQVAAQQAEITKLHSQLATAVQLLQRTCKNRRMGIAEIPEDPNTVLDDVDDFLSTVNKASAAGARK